MKVPDPNSFGGPVKLSKPGFVWQKIPLSHGYIENMRSIGVADMVKAIQKDRVNRCCSGELVSDLVSGTLNLS